MSHRFTMYSMYTMSLNEREMRERSYEDYLLRLEQSLLRSIHVRLFGFSIKLVGLGLPMPEVIEVDIDGYVGECPDGLSGRLENGSEVIRTTLRYRDRSSCKDVFHIDLLDKTRATKCVVDIVNTITSTRIETLTFEDTKGPVDLKEVLETYSRKVHSEEYKQITV